MNSALWVAKTGLDAQQTRISVISNNLANVNTAGFKQSRGVFQDLIYQNVRQVGGQSTQVTQLPSGLMLGTGTRLVSTEKLFTQGNISQTGNPLDLAIQGRGFFQVQMPNGNTAYTRDGSFQLNSQGQMVTASGYPLQPAITIPNGATGITVGQDGTVSVMTQGSTSPTQVGSIQLADFINPAGLQPMGQNLYLMSGSSGAPQTSTPETNGLGSLNQGSIETSNVNVVEELVNMIEAQRAYEMNSKAINTVDQMLQTAANNL